MFNYLREKQDDIEKAIGEKIDWVDAPVASRIKINKKVTYVFDQAAVEEYYKWLYEKTVLFKKVFGKYVKEFKK